MYKRAVQRLNTKGESQGGWPHTSVGQFAIAKNLFQQYEHDMQHIIQKMLMRFTQQWLIIMLRLTTLSWEIMLE